MVSFNSLRLYVLTEENTRTYPAFNHVSFTFYTVRTVGQNEENDKHCGKGMGNNRRGREQTERGKRQA